MTEAETRAELIQNIFAEGELAEESVKRPLSGLFQEKLGH
jgi:hypothetical protein